MAKGPLQGHRVLSSWGGLRRFLVRFAELAVKVSRHHLVAFVLIAFAISFGFRIEEHRNDTRLSSAAYNGCLRGNELRKQSNERLIIILDAQTYLQFKTIKGRQVFFRQLNRLTPLPLAKCKRTTQ